MHVNSTTAQFTASYSGVMGPAKIGKIEYSDLANAQKLDIPKAEGTWEDLFGLEITDTVAEDGTITRTMSGGCNLYSVSNPGRKGCTSFSVSLTFHPDTYEGGDLGATADLLAAAHAAEEEAMRTLSSGEAQERQLQRLDAAYEAQKQEAVRSFSGMVSGYLEAAVQSGQEEQKVARSVQAVFASREAKYRALAGGTRQELWISRNIFEAAVNLQKLGASFPVKDAPASGLYSLQELEAAAVRVSKGFSVTV